MLRELHGKQRLLLNDDQRRRLAVKGKVLGRKLLAEIGTLVTPDTILRWHRTLVADKWTYADRRTAVGRPVTPQEVVDLVLKIAPENVTWGYDRIADASANVGHEVSDQTVRNILKTHGIEPAPTRKRQMTWSTFLKAHWSQLAAVDFTTIEVCDEGRADDVLSVVCHAASNSPGALCRLYDQPRRSWMAQIALNLTDVLDGPLREAGQYLLMDRDTKFTAEFRAILKSAGVAPVLLHDFYR